MNNKFDQLVDDLLSGKIGNSTFMIAYKTSIRRSKRIHDGCKRILTGTSRGNAGIISMLFRVLFEVVGAIDHAYERGYRAGQEDVKRKLAKERLKNEILDK